MSFISKKINPGIGTYLRSLFVLFVKWVAHGPRLGSFHTSLHKLIVNFILHKCPRSGSTTLGLVEEQTKMGLLDSVFHWKYIIG